jgi:hypothetical protein
MHIYLYKSTCVCTYVYMYISIYVYGEWYRDVHRRGGREVYITEYVSTDMWIWVYLFIYIYVYVSIYMGLKYGLPLLSPVNDMGMFT